MKQWQKIPDMLILPCYFFDAYFIMMDTNNKFQRQGFIILMVCSAIMLGIGIFMFVTHIGSSSIITNRYGKTFEGTISWQMPIFGAAVLLILAVLIKIDKLLLPKMDVQEKRTFIFGKITDFLKGNDFKKRGNHFFKRHGDIGYCANIQNDKWNSAEKIRFTLNLGIFTENFWLEHYDFNHKGVMSSFPKEYECAIRERIGSLLPTAEDRWYCITSGTDVMKLWSDIERDIIDYVIPFFSKYNAESDVTPNQCIYRKEVRQ